MKPQVVGSKYFVSNIMFSIFELYCVLIINAFTIHPSRNTSLLELHVSWIVRFVEFDANFIKYGIAH